MASNIEKWIVAQKKHRISDKHVQMARELGLNPDKLGKIDNHQNEGWKVPIAQFIEDIYLKQFKKSEPDTIRSLDQILKDTQRKKDEKKEKKRLSKS